MQPRTRRYSLVLLVVAALGLAWLAREAQHRRIPRADGAGWFTTDPDSLYQMRRVERVLRDGLPVAGTDERLAWPEGSPIPWPPYYTRLCHALLAPFAPDVEAAGGAVLHGWVERSMATLPLVFGLLGVLLAALAGRALGGNAGAWIASTYVALCTVAIAYSKPGNGDHHAFVSLCSTAILLALTWALHGERMDRRLPSLTAGIAAGVVAGVQLGAWVGAMMQVVVVELVLGWLIVLSARRPRPGLTWLGLGFHLSAVGVLLPAVLASPWTARDPWMVVNLSWFHVAFLLVGAAVFVPLAFLGERRRVAYPWFVLALLALGGAALHATGVGPGRGLREAFSWAARENVFMARVRESESLLAAGAEVGLFEALGWGVLLFPLAWGALAWRAFARGCARLLPWVVASGLYALAAARQARFAEALVVPLAVVLGWGGARLLTLDRPRLLGAVGARLARWPAPLLALLGLVLVAGAHVDSVERSWSRLRAGPRAALQMEAPARLAARHMAEWLRASAPPGPDAGVLADWGWGHVIEWAGARPSVATNFGLYVGEESFRAPARFFLCEDPREAEALLARRRAGHVLLTSSLPDRLNSMVLAVDPSLRARYVEQGLGSGGALSPRWFRTMGARLMFDGGVFGPLGAGERPLDFLRLVHVSPLRDPGRLLRSATDVSPAGWVWQRVAGARLEAQGEPGDLLEVRVVIDYPGPGPARELVYGDRAVGDEEGVARLRLPYATLEPNGQGRVVEAAWRCAGEGGELRVSAQAVLAGETVRLR